MFNAGQLITDLLRSGLSSQSLNRVNHAANQGGLGQFGDQLTKMFGGGAAGGQGGLGDLAGRARDMLGQAGGAVGRGDPLAVGGLGAVVGALLGGGGRSMGGALGGAAMAVLGSLAYNALKGQAGQAVPPPASPSELPLGVRPPEDAAEEQALQNRSLLVLRAMITAAKADGQIDPSERQRILGKLEQAGEDQEARDFVAAEMARPFDLEALARDVPNPEAAAQVYAASLLAINIDTEAERAYLAQLASRIGLERTAVVSLHQMLGAPPPA
jgi:uncharacterized membrane protein YebE (DUF533 family)